METPLVLIDHPWKLGEKLEVEPNWLVERGREDFLRVETRDLLVELSRGG